MHGHVDANRFKLFVLFPYRLAKIVANKISCSTRELVATRIPQWLRVSLVLHCSGTRQGWVDWPVSQTDVPLPGLQEPGLKAGLPTSISAMDL